MHGFEPGLRYCGPFDRAGSDLGFAIGLSFLQLRSQHLPGAVTVLSYHLRGGSCRYVAGGNQALHIGVGVANCEYLLNVLPCLGNLLCDLLDRPAEGAQSLVSLGQFKRG